MQKACSTSEEDFRNTLKSHGMKATPQRLAVFNAMCRLGHASADQVCRNITYHDDVKITVASVYNILTEFTELGIFMHRLSADNKMVFDITTSCHAHFYDIENNHFKDIAPDKTVDELVAKLLKKKFRGYKVDYVDIQIVGHPTRRKKIQ